MAPSSRSQPKLQRSGTLRGFGPSFWRDVMFWITAALSLAVGAIVVIASFMLLSTPRTGAGWIWTLALFVLGSWCGFVVLSLGLNTARGVQRGAQEADSARGDRLEAHGRKAGKMVGSGLAKVTGRSNSTPTSSEPSPVPDTTRSTTPESDSQLSATKPTFDDAARSIGMMVGRRIGARKDKS